MFQSKIVCHTFLCLSPPRSLWNWPMETQDMPKGLGLFYVAFLTVPLFNQLDHFIIVQVTLPTPYHQVPSSFILVLRKLHLNLLNIVILLTLKVVLGDHPIRLATILTIFSLKFSKSILIETRIFLSQLSVDFQSKLCLNWFINVLVTSQSLDYNEWQEKDSWKVFLKIFLNCKRPALSVSWPKQLKFTEVQLLMSLNLPLGSCFKWISRFSMLKASVDLPQLLWLYALLLHTPLDPHPEVSAHLLIF